MDMDMEETGSKRGDVEEGAELQGVWPILRESWRLLVQQWRVLLPLAVLLVLPLSGVVLGHTLVTDPLINLISSNAEVLSAEEGEGSPGAAATRRRIRSGVAALAAALVAYALLLLSTSLLSTAAVVYSVACAYVDRALHLRQVLAVVPRVWRRLMLTLCCAFLIMLAYHAAAAAAVTLTLLLFWSASPPLLLILLLTLAAALLAAQVYVNLVWHLASVITVLERRYCGLSAIRRSTQLLRGKRRLGFRLMLLYMIAAGAIAAAFHAAVVANAHTSPPAARLAAALPLVAALTALNLFAFLAQCLFYFAAMAHHRQPIDRLALSNTLDAYLAGYLPLHDAPPPQSAVPLAAMPPRSRHDDDDDDDDLA